MNKYFVISLFVLIGVLALAFFWFEWRPSNIRKNCLESADEYISRKVYISSFSRFVIQNKPEETEKDVESRKAKDKEAKFKDCLRENGL